MSAGNSIDFSRREEVPENEGFIQHNYQESLGEKLQIDLDNIKIRRADGDDSEFLDQTIDANTHDILDVLYNYPKTLKLIETSYLSVTIIDTEFRVIGLAIFEDKPQGLEGMIDFKHENYWEHWLSKAYDIGNNEIRPSNTLWLTYFFLGEMNFYNGNLSFFSENNL